MNFEQVDGFLNNQKLRAGKSKKIIVGKVRLTYYCKNCKDQSVFYSGEDLYCIGVNDNTVSIDCVLKCPGCGSLVQVWILLEAKDDEDIHSANPYIRILKKSEKLSDVVSLNNDKYGDFTDLMDKAKRASRDGLGAGSIVYLRKIFERIIVQAANAATPAISTKTGKGKRKTFKDLLKDVDTQCSIIPREFSDNSYKLFGELSDVVHGDYDEEVALEKFSAFYRLVKGVLDNVKNNREMMEAIGTLGWNNGGDTDEQA